MAIRIDAHTTITVMNGDGSHRATSSDVFESSVSIVQALANTPEVQTAFQRPDASGTTNINVVLTNSTDSPGSTHYDPVTGQITIYINPSQMTDAWLQGENGIPVPIDLISTLANELGDAALDAAGVLSYDSSGNIIPENYNRHVAYSNALENKIRKKDGAPPRLPDSEDGAPISTPHSVLPPLAVPFVQGNITPKSDASFGGIAPTGFGGIAPLDSPFYGVYWIPNYEPLVLNLTANSAPVTTDLWSGTQFDLLNDGFQEQTAWIGAGSGILVNDPTGGAITNGAQMFGTSTSLSGGGYAIDGFAALADLDSNHDGVINSSDTAWSNLKVWIDANINGVTDSGELETMSVAGISSISLSTTNTNITDANGNLIGKTATYTTTSSQTREIADVSFATDPVISTPDTMVTVSPTIAALPDMQGNGIVTSLQQAMQIDGTGTLQGYVTSFASATDDATRNTLVDEIIYQWTGVAGVSSTARGAYVDARQLEALERFSVKNYVDPYDSTSNPSINAAPLVNTDYQQLHNEVLANLEKQTSLATLFTDIKSSDAYVVDFSDAETSILADLSANRAAGIETLTDFNLAAHVLGYDQTDGYGAFRSDLASLGEDIAAAFPDTASVIYGTTGDDVITAWNDNQTILAGQGGCDTLIGTGSNETFYGSAYSNLFIGGTGDNENFWGGSVFAASGQGDTFIVGQGTETFTEDTFGSVLVEYAAGDGSLTINGFSHQGTLQFDNAIDLNNITVQASHLFSPAPFLTNISHVITDGVSGDQITMNNIDVSTLQFVDGTTLELWNLGDIEDVSAGTVTGTEWNDRYRYASGAGAVTLSDVAGDNTLIMGSGILSGDVSFSTSGDDLLIYDAVGGDVIDDQARAVQTLQLADGSTVDLSALGSTYVLSGISLSATGTSANDTYSFAQGSGSASIADSGGKNTLVLGTSISTGDVSFTGSGTDLIILDGVPGDQIDISGQTDIRPIIQTLKFTTGGTTEALSGLTITEATGATSFTGTLGNDTLFGESGSQTINGNGGNDTFINGSGDTTANGGSGNDTYSFISGRGHLTIGDIGGQNEILFGTGILSGDISLSGSGNDLLITDSVSGDQVDVLGELGTQLPILNLVFSGGVTQSLLGISLLEGSGQSVLNGTYGSDTLQASNGATTLIGNGGNDTYIGASGAETLVANYGGNNTFIIGAGSTTVSGGVGDDLYSYAGGDGHLTISGGGGLDVLSFASDIPATSISFAESGSDLLVYDGIYGDEITLQGQLSPTISVQNILFSDSSTQSLDGITMAQAAGSNTLNGTSGSDTLIGGTGTQSITGNGGNDTFIISGGTTTVNGDAGNDIYSYASGSGALLINDSAGSNTITLNSSIVKANVSLVADGNDLLILDGVAGDRIEIVNQLAATTAIAEILFSDSTTTNLEGITLSAPLGTSTLNGTSGNDTLTGTTGTQTINGNGGNDTFIIGSRDTTANGSNGDDLYSYVSGDGFAKILDIGGTDTIKLGTGLTSANVSLGESSNGADLLIFDGISTDAIDITNGLDSSYRVEELIYGDGSTLDLTAGLKLMAADGTAYLHGTAGNDSLIGGTGTQYINGNGGNDVYVIGAGASTITGGSGDDNYSYASGKGLVTIYESGGTDTIKLGTGLTSANVSLSKDSTGYDLLITDNVLGDQIDVGGFFLQSYYAVETLVYGDGSTLDLSTLSLPAGPGITTINGTAGDDTLTGTTGVQTIYGNGGNDLFVIGTGLTTVEGNSGDDVYSYASGSGRLVINELSGADTIKLGTGLTSANVTISESSDSRDLIITDNVTNDQIDVASNFYQYYYQVETLIYGDGTTQDLSNNITVTAALGDAILVGTAGDDTLIGNNGNQTLYGYGGNDVYIAGTGNTTIEGSGGGNDIFSFASGSGLLTIYTGGGSDTLKLGTGLIAADVSFTENSNGNELLILDGVTGDQLEIMDWVGATSQTLMYGDGTTQSLTAGLLLSAQQGTAYLIGTTGDDTLVGGDGTQSINGNGGNDTFVIGAGSTSVYSSTGNDLFSYSSGDGLLTIIDVSGADTLKLGTGLTSANVSFSESASGDDLIIMDGVGGDLIDIVGQLPYSQIETLIYGDSTTLDLTAGQTLTAAVGDATLKGTYNDDTLIGTSGTQFMEGLGGNDVYIIGHGSTTVQGSGGNDIFSFASGQGYALIQSGGGTDTIKLGTGLTSANVTLAENQNASDILITDDVTGDLIDIAGEFSYGQIGTLIFGDGSTLDLTTNYTMTSVSGYATLNGSTGDDTLIANNGLQTINGNGGNDILVAGQGSSTLNGYSGNDIFSYNSGDGSTVIYGVYGSDTIKLGSGLTSANVSLSESNYGEDLIIMDGVSGDQIDALLWQSSIQTLVYGDGTTLTMGSGITLMAPAGEQTLTGTAGSDTLIGGIGAQNLNGAAGVGDVFIVGGGNTTISASYGDDIFSYASGAGAVLISDLGGTDTIKLGTGLTSANVSLAESADGYDLLIFDGTAGDKIDVQSMSSVETLIYGDGTTLNLTSGLNLTAVLGAATVNGTSGDDTLIGTSGALTVNDSSGGNNLYVIGNGTTTISAGTGNDVYSYASGKGNVLINDQGGADTIKLSTGLIASNVTLSEAANGYDLLITDGVAGDQIDVNYDFYPYYSYSSQVENLIYGDGTTLDLTTNLKLTAAIGTATLDGTAGNDTLIGNTGNQTINGNGGDDIYLIGAGNSTVNGGSGNDTYSYVSGKGLTTIFDTGGTDTIKLGTGMTSANVHLNKDSTGNDLLITDATAGDQIDVTDFFISSSYRPETLIYGNGTTLNLSTLTLAAGAGITTFTGTSGNNTLTGTTGTQIMNGNGGNDLFIIGTGATTVNAGNGNDVFSFASGKGRVFINETGGTDTLKLGTGLTFANVSLTEASNGYDLLITDGVAGDMIDIVNDFNSSTYQVEKLIYGDGTTLNISTNLKIAATNGTAILNGTTGNDTLTGGSGNQSINGNGGNDTYIIGAGNTTINGGTGNDIYSYTAGKGIANIAEQGGTDTIKLGTGLTSANVSLSESNNGYDLLITDGTSGDLIDVTYGFYNPASYGVEELIYGDGTTLDLTAGIKVFAPSGSALLYGTSGNDTLTGGIGTQLLIGISGNDTYIVGGGATTIDAGAGDDIFSYSSGDGSLTVNESAGNDTLKLGTGLTSANVTLSENFNGSDMIITDGIAGDSIDLYHEIGSSGYQIEELIYGDGTTLDLTTNLNLVGQSGQFVLEGTTGNDTITSGDGAQTVYGQGGNDVFIVGAGTTKIFSGSGDDTYSYASGKGLLTIQESGGSDTLKLGTGLTASNIWVQLDYANNDLLVTDSTPGDQIDIVGDGRVDGNIETLIYGDGTTLNLSTALEAAFTGVSSVNGTTGNDLLATGSSLTTLNGGGGTDTYDYGRYMAQDVINNGVASDNTAAGNLLFGHQIADTQLWFDRVDNSGAISSSGKNLRIDIMGSTSSITMDGWYNGSFYTELSSISLSDSGLKLDTQVNNLVQAMATFESGYQTAHGTAFDPTAVANSTITDATVLTAVSSDWHS